MSHRLTAVNDYSDISLMLLGCPIASKIQFSLAKRFKGKIYWNKHACYIALGYDIHFRFLSASHRRQIHSTNSGQSGKDPMDCAVRPNPTGLLIKHEFIPTQRKFG